MGIAIAIAIEIGFEIGFDPDPDSDLDLYGGVERIVRSHMKVVSLEFLAG